MLVKIHPIGSEQHRTVDVRIDLSAVGDNQLTVELLDGTDIVSQSYLERSNAVIIRTPARSVISPETLSRLLVDSVQVLIGTQAIPKQRA